MTLLEALANTTDFPVTIVKPDYWAGRQYRWYDGKIQTRTQAGRKWYRTLNIPTSFLESCEVDDNEVL